MIAAKSMHDSTFRPTWRRFLYVAAGQLLVTLAVVLLIVPLSAGWAAFAGNFFYGLAYANCIGWLSWLIMPSIGAIAAHMKPVPGWILVIGSLITLAIVGSLLAVTVLAGFGVFHWSQYWARFWGGFQLMIVISLVIGTGFFLFENLRYRLQHQATTSRLSSLESRLRPHFLFNTLNSISALIPEDPAAAERMTEKLAALLRFSLDATDRRTVPLATELTVMTDYLEIEKMRFGSRLSYSVDVPPDLMHIEVPPFCLQTVVENGVKHGGGEIRVRAEKRNGIIALTVWDSGRGFTETALRPGHSLHNLRSRLAVLWGSGATLEFQCENSGNSVRIRIPETHEKQPGAIARLLGR
jgi:hypothetical protein